MLLTKLRTKMVDVKDNFKNKYQNNMNCELCGMYENQEHLLDCDILILNCKELYNDSVVECNDIFGNERKQLPAVRLFQKVLDIKEKILNEKTTRDNLVQCTIGVQ